MLQYGNSLINASFICHFEENL